MYAVVTLVGHISKECVITIYDTLLAASFITCSLLPVGHSGGIIPVESTLLSDLLLYLYI